MNLGLDKLVWWAHDGAILHISPEDGAILHISPEDGAILHIAPRSYPFAVWFT